MAFITPPSQSKKQIDKAGKVLITQNFQNPEFVTALKLAERWRASHAYPINTFQATLRTKLRSYHPESIAAQRLKRMPTIIDKLKRYPAMKLTTMQDIGGVRAILRSVIDADRLANDYRNNRRMAHELVDQKNYIQYPRSEDGYRGIHLIYKYKNKTAPQYENLRIELQIRTKLQHVWATAVESMGTFLGQALKSRKGDQEWLDFFALVSSAFALREQCSPIPRFAHLSGDSIIFEISNAEARLGALEMMRGLSIAANAISNSRNPLAGWSYHLIILNSVKKTVQIKSYSRDEFEKAIEDYGKIETEAAKGAQVEPVLVSAGPIDKLRKAYPNFFLDVGTFTRIIDSMCKKARN